MVNGENNLYTDEDDHIELKILKYLQSHQLDICIKIVFNIYANSFFVSRWKALLTGGFYRYSQSNFESLATTLR